MVEAEDGEQSAVTVAVTGAAGSVGALVVQLALDAGHDVIAVDRPGAAFPKAARPYTVREGDLTERRFCRKAVRDATVVIHAAAHNNPSRPYEELEPTNVEATRWLYEAAEDYEATRFVHISTASLYRQQRGVLDEESELDARSSYDETKEEAERFLRSRRSGALEWVILRPSLIYGPRARAFGATILTIPPILRMFVRYLPSFTGGPRINWVHAEDVARAALLVATSPEAANTIYNVADDVPLSYGEIMSAAIQAYGLEIGPTIQFPQRILTSVSRVFDADIVFRVANNLVSPVWQRIRQHHGLTDDLRPGLDRSLLDYMTGDRVLSNARLKELGWRPKWPDLRNGVAEAVKWYQQAKWLPDFHAIADEDQPPETRFGLVYHELLKGTADSGAVVVLDLDVTFPNLKNLLMDGTAMLEGLVSVTGLAERRPLKGTVEINPTSGTLIYQFGFDGDDGSGYRFLGEKHLSMFSPLTDFANLEGRIINSRGEQVVLVKASLNLKDGLAQTLMSLRLG